MAPLGKFEPAAFDRLVSPFLGAAREDVLVGPGIGRDAAIVRIGAGRVLAATTDPLSLVPALGPETSARLACHLLASDLWTTGIPPAHAVVDFNLSPDTTDEAFGAYWRAMSDTWYALEVAVISGHTGRYAGCAPPIIGAATLIGIGDENRHLAPRFVADGDRVILTKGCAIETTAIAAHLFPERLASRLGEDGVRRARAMIDDVSVVADCRALVAVGVRDRGVSMLHDATEGGVCGGLVEIARGCAHDLRIERERIPLSAEARAACEAFEIDPWWALSEGTLIATVRPGRVDAALRSLAAEGIAAADVGEVVAGAGIVWMTESDGHVTRIEEARPDPYWDAYERAVREGWR